MSKSATRSLQYPRSLALFFVAGLCLVLDTVTAVAAPDTAQPSVKIVRSKAWQLIESGEHQVPPALFSDSELEYVVRVEADDALYDLLVLGARDAAFLSRLKEPLEGYTPSRWSLKECCRVLLEGDGEASADLRESLTLTKPKTRFLSDTPLMAYCALGKENSGRELVNRTLATIGQVAETSVEEVYVRYLFE